MLKPIGGGLVAGKFALIAVAVLLLVNAAAMVAYLKAPVWQGPLAAAEMTPDGGFAYTAPLHFSLKFPYRIRPDDIVGGSSMILRENGQMLGPPHAVHQDIRDLGQGRFSHWRSDVFFSASDNSDPRTNGRTYLAADHAILSPSLVGLLLGMDAMVVILVAHGGFYFGLCRAAMRVTRNLDSGVAASSVPGPASKIAPRSTSARLPSRRRYSPVRAVVLAASVLLVLLNTAAAVFALRAPQFETSLAPGDMMEGAGFVFAASLNINVRFPYRVKSDDTVGGSSLILREDGRLLGPPHALYQDVRDLGQGRYFHVADTVYFSCSDNTDPRETGRSYTASDRAILDPLLVRILFGLDAIAAILAACAALYFGSRLAAARLIRIPASGIAGLLEPHRLSRTIRRAALAAFDSPRRRKRVRAAALAVTLILVLVNAAAAIFALRAPTFETGLTPADMAENSGFAFTVPLHFEIRLPYRVRSDDLVGGSSMILREDGLPLAQAHALHQDIRNLGRGRYSHWRNDLYFSSSDNSDPRANGRTYTAVTRAILSPLLVRILVLIDAVAGVLVASSGIYVGSRFALRRFSTKALRIAGIALFLCAFGFLLTSPIFRHLGVLFGASGAALYLGARSLGAAPPTADLEAALPRVVARRDWLVLVAMLVGVASFLCFGPTQIYPAPGWADPSIYHGYFTHYGFNLLLNGQTYFSERLAFILPGILFFAYFPVASAYYLLALLPLALACASLFFIVFDFAGPILALGAVALVCVNALLVGATGQGYLAGTVLAWMFAGFTWLLRSAARHGTGRSSFAAGACLAVAVFTNPVAVLHLPGALGAFLLAYPNARTRLIARLGWGASGGLFVLCGFAVANKVLTGSFDFITPALREAGNAESTQFAVPTSLWVAHATRLWYLVIEVVCGFVVLRRCTADVTATRTPAALALRWSVLSLSATAAVFVASDILLKTAYLTYWFYSCYFVIYAAVIAAAILALALPSGLSRREQATVALCCGIAAALTLVGPLMTQDVDPETLHLQAVAILGGAGSVALLWLATMGGATRRILRTSCCVVATAIPLLLLDVNPDTRHFFVYRNTAFRDAAVTAAEANRFIDDSLRGRVPFFWYSRDEYTRRTAQPRAWRFPNSGVYPLWFKHLILFNLLDQIWCNYYTPLLQGIDDARSLGEAVPDWSPVLALRAPSAVVVLSSDAEDGPRAVARAQALFGATLVPRAHDYVSHGQFAAHVWVLDVANPGEPRLVRGEQAPQ